MQKIEILLVRQEPIGGREDGDSLEVIVTSAEQPV